MQAALLAEDLSFIAHPCFQNVLTKVWYSKIEPDVSWTSVCEITEKIHQNLKILNKTLFKAHIFHSISNIFAIPILLEIEKKRRKTKISPSN